MIEVIIEFILLIGNIITIYKFVKPHKKDEGSPIYVTNIINNTGNINITQVK